MTVFTKKAVDIFAAQDASGDARKVSNHDVQVWGTEVERAIKSFQAGGGVVFDSKTEADGSLDYNAYTMAWVFDVDPDKAGIYQKQGASGSGSWQRVGDLPYSFILATNTNSGDPNAIEATTPVAIPAADGGALIALPIVADNTASPVTVSFNGATPLTIKTASGSDIAPGGLTQNMIVWGYKQGTNFRLATDQASAAIQAAAEAAQAAAEDWAIRPEDDPVPASSGGDGSTTFSALHWAKKSQGYAADASSAAVISFATVANLIADTTLGYSGSGAATEVSAGAIVNAQGFRYEVADSAAVDEHVTTAGGVKLYVKPSPIGTYSAAQFGAVGDGSDETAELTALAAAAAADKTPIWFPWGSSGTYRWDMSSTVDLSGIPWIDGDGITIDTSNATATQCFHVEGTRSAALASGISLSAGHTISQTISTADLPVGSTLVIASSEKLANTIRSSYRKGGSFLVKANDGAGTIEVNPAIPYSFTSSAYLYRIDEAKFELRSGVTVKGKVGSGSAQNGFRYVFANVTIHGKTVGFRGIAHNGVTSRLQFYGESRGANGSNGTGIDLNDGAVGIIHGYAEGEFHAVDGGGESVAFWDQSYVGGSDAANLAIPSRVYVTGGEYGSDAGATGGLVINAHGIVDTFTVADGVKVNGGSINTSARVSTIGAAIVEGEHPTLLNFGADNNSTAYGEIYANGCRLKRYGAQSVNNGVVQFNANAAMKRIELFNIRAEGDYVGSSETQVPILIQGDYAHLEMDNVIGVRGPSQTSRAAYIEVLPNAVTILRNMFYDDGNRIDLKAMGADVNLWLDKVRVHNAVAGGGIRLLVDNGMNWNVVTLDGCEGVGCTTYGLDVTTVKTLIVNGGRFSDNNASSGRAMRLLKVQTFVANGVDMSNCLRPFDQTDYGSGSTAAVTNCDVRSNPSSMSNSLGTGVTWAARQGNMGDDRDYIRFTDGALYETADGTTWTAI